MKVVVLAPGCFDKGGISRYIRYQVRALREYGATSDVMVLSMAGRTDKDLEEPFEVAWAGPTQVDKCSRALFASKAINCAYDYGADVVLSGHINLGPVALVASRISRARMVQNVYGREVWSGLSVPRRRACAAADLVVADCLNTLQVSQRLGIVRKACSVVHDCVDLARFSPGDARREVLRRYGIEKRDRFRLLLLGRLNRDTRYKGTERALSLLASLPASFELVLAGDGDDRAALSKRAERMGVSSRVNLPGPVKEADLVDVYRSADVFYLVSDAGPGRGEGLPLTPIEAMGCGVPVVVGNCDGSREIIETGGGTVVSPLDTVGPREYIQKLASDPGFAARERALARSRAVEEFGYDLFARRTAGAILRARPQRTSGG